MRFKDVVNKLLGELQSFESAMELTYNSNNNKIVVKGFNKHTRRWEEILNVVVEDRIHIHEYQDFFGELKYWDKANLKD
jgi:uncharacterized phage-like protein YoqJ